MTARMCRWLFGVLLACVAQTACGQATHVDREGFPLPTEAVARIGSARLRHLGIIHGVAYSRDGKQIISIGADDRICVWDAATGKLLRSSKAGLGKHFAPPVRIADNTVGVATHKFLFSFDAYSGKVLHKIDISEMPFAHEACFSPDGAWFAYGSRVLNVHGNHDGKGSLPPWNADQAPDLWKELAGADGERAFQTVRRLVHHPQAAVALLRAHLLPRVQEQGKQFAQLLRALDSDDFETRQQAQTNLKQRADEFELFLSRTRVRDYPLEVQRRLEPIIAKLDPANSERLRRLRAMEALRQIATPEARRLLESVTGSGAAKGRKQ